MVILGSGEVMSHLYLSLCFSIFLKDLSVHKDCFYNKYCNKIRYVRFNVSSLVNILQILWQEI